MANRFSAADPRRRRHLRRAGILAGTDPHDPASVLRLSQLDKTATGMQMQFPTLTGKTYRLEYTDDLTTHQWHPLTAPIPGDGYPVQVVDPAGAIRPQRFYRLRVMEGQ